MRLAFPRKHVVCYPGFHKDILRNLFLNKGQRGALVENLERNFAEYVGVTHAIAVSSRRQALYSILKNLGIGKEDEVLLPAVTHPSMALVIKDIGAKPLFLDFSSGSFSIDLNHLKRNINDKTMLIIATHLFGVPCDIKNVMQIAKDRNIEVIEDCAHSIGVAVDGKKAGSFGKAGFFSFETTKSINALGGGMITTDDYHLYARIKKEISSYRYPAATDVFKKILRFHIHSLYSNRFFFAFGLFPLFCLLDNFGIDLIQFYKKRRKMGLGSYKTRFSDMQSVLATKQLNKIEENNKKIKESVESLKERITSPYIKYIEKPRGVKDVQYLFTLLLENRDIFRKLLLRRGIDSEKDLFQSCPKLFENSDEFHNSKEILQKTLQISIHAGLSKNDISYIANAINKISADLGP